MLKLILGKTRQKGWGRFALQVSHLLQAMLFFYSQKYCGMIYRRIQNLCRNPPFCPVSDFIFQVQNFYTFWAFFATSFKLLNMTSTMALNDLKLRATKKLELFDMLAVSQSGLLVSGFSASGLLIIQAGSVFFLQ